MKKLAKKIICILSAISMTAMPIQVMATNTSGVSIETRAITTSNSDMVIAGLETGEIFRDGVAEPFVIFSGVPLKFTFKVASEGWQFVTIREHTKNHEKNIYSSKIIYRGFIKNYSYRNRYWDDTTYVYFTVQNHEKLGMELSDIKVSY